MKFKISIDKLNQLQNKLDIINKYDVLVNTECGYKKIKAVGITTNNSIKIEIETKDFKLSGSPEHRVKYLNNWIYLKDIKVGDKVNTINGVQEIVSRTIDTNKEDLWDIEVDGSEYYSNGILSHNSSLIECFDFTLYGKVRGRKKKWSTLSTLPNRINGELLNSIKFNSNGVDVEIKRGISPNVLELIENGNPYEKAGKANLDDRIENYIGMDIETFKSFISMSINDFKNFISLTSEEKQLLLDKLFNLEVINILNTILKDLNKNNKLKSTSFEAEARTLDDSILSIKNSIQRAIEREKAEAALAKEREKEDIQAEIDRIMNEINLHKDEYKILKEKIDKIKEKENELSSELDLEKRQLINTQNDIRNVQKEIELYNSGKCPTCKTDFNSEHFSDLKSVLDSKKESLLSIKTEIETNVNKISERQSKLKGISETTNTAFNDLTYLLKSYKIEIDKLNQKKSTQTNTVINTPSVNILEFENTIDELQRKKENSIEVINICKEKELYYKELNRIFGEDGVKKSIISSIIKPINHFISDNIKKMGLNFDVKLDETFTAEIKHLGSVIDPESLSTGENRRINVSILISYLMLIRTKKYINILFLDEVFSSVDLQGITDILTVLKDFASNYKINIFVVHHAILNEEIFDRVIRINKEVFSSIEEVSFK